MRCASLRRHTGVRSGCYEGRDFAAPPGSRPDGKWGFLSVSNTGRWAAQGARHSGVAPGTGGGSWHRGGTAHRVTARREGERRRLFGGRISGGNALIPDCSGGILQAGTYNVAASYPPMLITPPRSSLIEDSGFTI